MHVLKNVLTKNGFKESLPCRKKQVGFFLPFLLAFIVFLGGFINVQASEEGNYLPDHVTNEETDQSSVPVLVSTSLSNYISVIEDGSVLGSDGLYHFHFVFDISEKDIFLQYFDPENNYYESLFDWTNPSNNSLEFSTDLEGEWMFRLVPRYKGSESYDHDYTFSYYVGHQPDPSVELEILSIIQDQYVKVGTYANFGIEISDPTAMCRWYIKHPYGEAELVSDGPSQCSFIVLSQYDGCQIYCVAEGSDGTFVESNHANLYTISEPYVIFTEKSSYAFDEMAYFHVTPKDNDQLIWYLDNVRVGQGESFSLRCQDPGLHSIRCDVLRGGIQFDSCSLYIDIGAAPDDFIDDLDLFEQMPINVTRYEYDILKRLEFLQYAVSIMIGFMMIFIFKKN